MPSKLGQIKSEAATHLRTLETQAKNAAKTRGGLTANDTQRISDAKKAVTDSSRAEDAEHNAQMAIQEISKLVQQILHRTEKKD